jgi:hypothetical protein
MLDDQLLHSCNNSDKLGASLRHGLFEICHLQVEENNDEAIPQIHPLSRIIHNRSLSFLFIKRLKGRKPV